MNRQVQIISEKDKERVRQHFNEYLKELSQFDKTIDFDENGTPIYRWFDCYWEDEQRFPFLLNIENHFAGLALVRQVSRKKFEIAEFYVLPTFRKDGNALDFATQISSQFDGEITFSTCLENLRAVRFWDNFASTFQHSTSFIKDGRKTWLIRKGAKIRANIKP